MQGTLHKSEMYSFSRKIYLDPSLISSPVGSIVDGGNVLLGGNTISGRAQPNQQQEKPKKRRRTKGAPQILPSEFFSQGGAGNHPFPLSFFGKMI